MSAAIDSVCICGAGTMGSGIAQVAATAGISTMLYDISASVLKRSQESIEAGLQHLVVKQKISPGELTAILSRINFTDRLPDCNAHVFIEAIAENLEWKVSLLRELANAKPAGTILATNTSSLSVNTIAASVPNPERVVGMHFFNPPTVMKLVEIVRGGHTADEVVHAVTELASRLGKTSVLCKDSPGFIVNRVARPYYLEALRLMEAGMDPATIDAAMEACGFRMGPFKLMDLIGNDINYAVTCSVYEAMAKPARLKPSALQRQKVETNKLGRKTGEGYYKY